MRLSLYPHNLINLSSVMDIKFITEFIIGVFFIIWFIEEAVNRLL